MIVYTGKQRGNDFNNGDEALFQDANRPRDNDKFKLKPGLQSDKWDWRGANKDISVHTAQLVGEGQATVGAATTFPDTYSIVKLNQKYKKGDPGCIINKDGNIEIVEDGTYVVQAFCEFLFSSNPSYTIVENVVFVYLDENGSWSAFSKTQGRACTMTDQLVAISVSYFSKGTILNVAAAHNSSSQVTLYQVLNINRLV